MQFRILGPLEVAETDREISLGGGRQRAVLALLLLHPNEVVSSERLIDELWGGAPPPTAAKTVQVYVSQLRKALRNGVPDGPLLTRGRGYVLRVEPGELDLERFEAAVADGRRELDRDAPARAADRLREGLALWRGPPLADFAYDAFAQPEIARLEELRLDALEARLEADLELGRHAEVTAELEQLVAAHPLRERLREQLMLALYRSGRQADALAVQREGRARLMDELGLEPSPALRELEARILAHDPALAPPARRRGAPPPRQASRGGAPAAAARPRARTVVAAGVALLAAVAVAGAAQALRGGEPELRAPLGYNAVAAVDPASGAIRAAVPLPNLARLAVDGEAAWVGSDASGTVSAIDLRSHRVTSIVGTGVFPSDVAAGDGRVWVVDGSRGVLVQVDVAYGRVVDRLRLRPRGAVPGGPPDRFGLDPTAVAVGAGSAWVTDGSTRLLRVDPATTTVQASIDTGRPLGGVVVAGDSVWTVSGPRAELLRIDPRTNTVAARIAVVDSPSFESPYPLAVAVAGGFVWVLNGNTAAVTKVDPQARGIVGTVRIGVDRVPQQIAGGRDALWVANDDGTLARIDAVTDELTTIPVGRSLQDVAVGGGAVWTTNQLSDCCGND